MRGLLWTGMVALWGWGCAPAADGGAAEDTAGQREGEGPDRARAALIAEVRAGIGAAAITPVPEPPIVDGALFALGQALAFDTLLSGNRDVSCMTCHHPLLGTDDDMALSVGVGGAGLGDARLDSTDARIPRNAPALFNLHSHTTMFWDGRVAPDGAGGFVSPAGAALTPAMLADMRYGLVAVQALFPVTSRDEMRGHPGENELADIEDGQWQQIWAALMDRIGAVPAYRAMFEAAYPGTAFDDMHFGHAANAIAAFEVTAFCVRESPWERFLRGEDDALRTDQLEGAAAFFRAGCASCHRGPGLSDMGFHAVALAQLGPGKGHGASGHDDWGRGAVTGLPADVYRFRTPPLHNVGLTGPWGHAGQYNDLAALIDHYRQPDRSLRRYDPVLHVDDEVLWTTEQPTTAALLAARDPALPTFTVSDRRRILDFLEALDDPDQASQPGWVPGVVPSGLPVEQE